MASTSSSSSSSSSSPAPPSFADFPNDVQLNILSFLSPTDISAFACTSRHFSSLCSPSSPASSSLYLSICLRRWGSETQISIWGSNFPLLYRTLEKWAPLIGFWRQIGPTTNHPLGAPPLVLFEWGPSSITASRISPSAEPGSYGVVKIPFLWLGMSKNGEAVSYLSLSGSSESELVKVGVNFIGRNSLVVEESRSEDEEEALGSSPDRVMGEIYEYFANRTSPVGERGLRRMRRKKDGRRRRRRWEAEHFVKIGNGCPTRARPLQGLWKVNGSLFCPIFQSLEIALVKLRGVSLFKQMIYEEILISRCLI